MRPLFSGQKSSTKRFDSKKKLNRKEKEKIIRKGIQRSGPHPQTRASLSFEKNLKSEHCLYL